MHRARPPILTFGALALALWGCGDLLGSSDGGGPATLTSLSPPDGETNVSVLAPIDVGFSRSVDPAVVPDVATLWNNEILVSTTSLFAARNRLFRLQPTDPLDFGTHYRATLSGALTLREGSVLQGGSSWGFTTEGLRPPILDQDSLVFHLEALAHDTMRGRGSGSADELKAAEYLGGRFASYGLAEPPGGFVQSFEGYSASLGGVLTSRNVLGAVEGFGALSQEWVVVGAHYDHIGFRGLDDESQGPNNGADDNGSGTVMILEMARAFQAYVDAGGTASRDRRSVLFAAFGAEEQGLLGSCAYVYGEPAIPLTQIRAMMNFDMVGRLRENTVFLSGGETSPAWSPLVQNSNEPGLDLALSESSCTGCTDHACFWRAGIPFLGFFTGLHPEYHGPDDDTELIDFPGMVRIGELALRVLNRLVVMPESPPLTGTYPSAG